MGERNVRDTLKELGLAAAKSRGQNFLRDENQIRRLATAVLRESGGGPGFLEIGPGLGALTRPLLEAGAEILAVELDRGLAENLQNLAGQHPGRLTVICRDILTITADDLAGGPRFVCGNLPYNISSPALFWFLTHRRHFTGAVFMLQKEMARRLTAEPGSGDYGRLAVALNLWCRVKGLFMVPPSAFHPRPRVESAVVTLTPVRPDEEPAVDLAALSRFTAAAFAARRKTIFNNLAKAYGRPAAVSALADLGLAPGLRAEVFDPSTLAALAAILETG